MNFASQRDVWDYSSIVTPSYIARRKHRRKTLKFLASFAILLNFRCHVQGHEPHRSNNEENETDSLLKTNIYT